MDRADLLKKLKLVAPAISDSDAVPVLTHFWFRDNELMAYDGDIAISTTFDAEGFEGAVPDTLMSLLAESKANTVTFRKINRGEIVEVEAATGVFRLPCLPVSKCKILKIPDSCDKYTVDMAGFIQGLELCKLSLKEDRSIPDTLGVTAVFGSGFLDLYSTDNSTITTVRVAVLGECSGKAVLSWAFCKQLLKLDKPDCERSLEIGPVSSVLRRVDGIKLFGHLVNVKRPLDYPKVIDEVFPPINAANYVPIPSRLEAILKRAVIICKGTDALLDITVEKNKIWFSTKSERGEVNEHLFLEEYHPDVSLRVDPKLVSRACGSCHKMAFTHKCMALTTANSLGLYLVSAV